MKNNVIKKIYQIAFILGALVLTVSACKKEENNPDLDNQLYNEIKSSTGWLYYQNGDTLPGTSPSPHGSFRLRFNATAQTVLDTANELPTGSSFPTGSILVKEVIKNGSLNLLVVMKKNPSGTDAASGWQWGEYHTDGSVEYSAGKKGDACISCHTSNPNRDLTKTFDLH
ncbi:MAG TPA: cytochrome P460 family protein [Bacteroidales bacterium]|nr:cytochrome P460 family protein [Bacteroidales bacterium]HPE58052.1 cytochrome P460 family protein [Bacteroidales bacterium]HRX95660.1 cytochrome P460 family protein [Bacteroidales bacterium]